MSASIYTDGHGVTLTRGQLDGLLAAGVIRPHPGRGHDGIGQDDYILAPGATWDDVYAAINPKGQARREAWQQYPEATDTGVEE